jgi:hypothetical protein
MPTPPPSNNIPAPSETGSDPTSNWGSRYRGVRSPHLIVQHYSLQLTRLRRTGRSRRPRPRPRPLNPPHHPRRPSPLLRLRARLHAPHSPRPDLQNPARLHFNPVNQSATAVRQHHRKRQRREGDGEVQEEGPEVRSHHDGDSAGGFAGFLRGRPWWGEAGVCGCDGPREEVCVGGCYEGGFGGVCQEEAGLI